MDFTKKMFGFKNPFSGGADACGGAAEAIRESGEKIMRTTCISKAFRMPEGTEGPEDYMPSDNHRVRGSS
ncbi:MAG: hypothetical protein ACLTSZ_04775 [Lachnospiraceae bacterium]